MPEKPSYVATLAKPLADVLPPHACIEAGARVWAARWTTPRGVWSVSYREPQTEANTAKVTGPGLDMTVEPPHTSLILTVLRAREALPAEDAV